MSSFERWSVWISAVLTTVTGIGLFWSKYFLDAGDPWSVVNHPLQPWVLKAHIVSAPLLVFALGMIALRHIWKHFRNGPSQGRRSGIITGLVTVPMILSGYLIQAVTHTAWLQAIAISHIALGLAFGFGLSLHQLFVSQRPRPSHASDGPAAHLQGGAEAELGRLPSLGARPRRASSPAEAEAAAGRE